MIDSINVYRVESIEVKWKHHGETSWQQFTFHGAHGETFEIIAFVTQPTPIDGAELLVSMAQAPDEMTA